MLITWPNRKSKGQQNKYFYLFPVRADLAGFLLSLVSSPNGIRITEQSPAFYKLRQWMKTKWPFFIKAQWQISKKWPKVQRICPLSLQRCWMEAVESFSNLYDRLAVKRSLAERLLWGVVQDLYVIICSQVHGCMLARISRYNLVFWHGNWTIAIFFKSMINWLKIWDNRRKITCLFTSNSLFATTASLAAKKTQQNLPSARALIWRAIIRSTNAHCKGSWTD